MQTQNQQKIMKDYQVKADIIIRKMIQVLAQAHKKIDKASYLEWVQKLKAK